MPRCDGPVRFHGRHLAAMKSSRRRPQPGGEAAAQPPLVEGGDEEAAPFGQDRADGHRQRRTWAATSVTMARKVVVSTSSSTVTRTMSATCWTSEGRTAAARAEATRCRYWTRVGSLCMPPTVTATAGRDGDHRRAV